MRRARDTRPRSGDLTMCAALTLPADLTAAEQAAVARLRDEATARAALAFNVRREIERLVQGGLTIGEAVHQVGDDRDYPVSAGVANNIWYRRRGWEL